MSKLIALADIKAAPASAEAKRDPNLSAWQYEGPHSQPRCLSTRALRVLACPVPAATRQGNKARPSSTYLSGLAGASRNMVLKKPYLGVLHCPALKAGSLFMENFH
jgi:hypothetical protein